MKPVYHGPIERWRVGWGRVGSGGVEVSRVGLGRVGSDQENSTSHGSGRVGSRGFKTLASRIGSGQVNTPQTFGGSGRVS